MTAKRALITGITGFVGSHMAEYLLAHQPDVEIFGTARWRSRRDNIEGIVDRVRLIECDLTDSSSVRAMIEGVRPDHLLARAGRHPDDEHYQPAQPF